MCFNYQGPTCPENWLKDVGVEMSKILGSPQCASTNVTTLKQNITIQQTDDGDSLPDSRYITLTRTNQPLMIAEIQVFGGELKSYDSPTIIYMHLKQIME